MSLFDDTHHVEIGTASSGSYRDSFINCSDYLTRVKRADPDAIFMSITQNHLPGAGGSLVHPHLQVHATKQVSNNHRVLKQRTQEYETKYNACILSDLLIAEKEEVWQDLAEGVLNTQKFYKSLNRNAYNLTLLSIEDGQTIPCLKVSLTARSSYAPWVRSDFTGLEIASGEMATFTFPESVAAMARVFWKKGMAEGKTTPLTSVANLLREP
ncbi:MAG: hypothetical protein GY799_32115 [Desulfobulbaceae bacterium]|nr:hypothetical protein [Desulfobulbaceae bacterium]